MWQRIQNLYLGISTGLIIALFFCTYATIIGPNGAEAHIYYYEKMPFLVLLIMLTSAHIAAIGCYKSFMLQARVSIIGAFIALGFQCWMAIDYFSYNDQMVFSFTMLFPLAVAVLDFMAARSGLVDEVTVSAIKGVRKSRKKRKK